MESVSIQYARMDIAPTIIVQKAIVRFTTIPAQVLVVHHPEVVPIA